MNKSKLFSLVLIALFVFSLTLSTFAVGSNDSNLTFSVEASASSVKAGDEITFFVSLAENPGFKWARTELHFDTSVLTYKSTSLTGSIYADSGAYATEIGTNELSNGLLKFTIGDMYAALGAGTVDYVGTGLLYAATFTVVDNFEGNISVTATASSTNIRDLNNQISTVLVVSDSCSVVCVSANHVHSPVEIPGVAPTCSTPGKTKGSYCSTCGATLVAQTEIPATGNHTAVVDAKVNPTCTDTGLTEGSHCSVCGLIIVAQEIIPALGHTRGDVVKENDIPASCGSDGSYDEVVYCTVCLNEIERKTTIVPSTGEHVFATEAERVEPTCTSDGYYVMACTCGETQRTLVPALGHQEAVLEGYSATCTESGLTDGMYCTVCGEVTKAQEIIPTAEHEEEIVSGYSATCTEPGKTEGVICVVCNTILVAQTDIPAFGHTAIHVSAVAATCSSTGLTEGTKCATCGITISGREVIEKTAHTEAILPYVAPTCSTPGYEEGKYCSVCNEILVPQVEIATTEHTSEDIAPIEPTCSSVGWSEGTKCSVCGEILTAPTEIAKTEHTVVTGEPVAPTCTSDGTSGDDYCAVCGEVVAYGTVAPALGHTYDNNCDLDCNSCGEERTSVEHTFGEWVISKEATKKADGERVRTCSVCNYKETQVITAVSGGNGLIVGIAFVVMIASVVVIVVFVRKKK